MAILLLILMLFTALQAIHVTRLLDSVLWLAALSVLVSILLYSIGAWQMAVIELSIGAGLATVLLIFAITMVGERVCGETAFSGPVLFFSFTIILLVVTLTLPPSQPPTDASSADLNAVLWHDRGLDVIGQVGLIFAGILGVLGLLRTTHHTDDTVAIQSTHIDIPEEQAQREVI